jgi:UDP-N-acetylglucosamine 2-epimerase (non-hydrolysing)
MFVFGTRPDAIKLAPLILKAKKDGEHFDTVIVVTAQHRQMLDDVLGAFDITPDCDLNIMAPEQSLFFITARVFEQMEEVLKEFQPEIIVVQGDTTTSFAAAMAGYYAGRKVAHVEAGLRTGNKWAPFPEEINRRIISAVADYHFAPTERAKQNLLREGYEEDSIYVTGNTVIDALLWTVDRVKHAPCPVAGLSETLEKYEKMVLITGHRRENFGEPFRRIAEAFRALALKNPQVCFVYPVHLNPNVQKPVRALLEGIENFFLLAPLPYPAFVWFMQRSYLIISDSGGIQEEAPALGKPVLVTRRVTERPEAVQLGVVTIVGDNPEKIIEYTQRLLLDSEFHKSMAKGISPYGDGKASDRILACFKDQPFDEFKSH